jgi:uncharacterized protein (TIGR03083 family)
VSTLEVPDLGTLYRDSRERLTGLVGQLDGDSLETPVPACPGWSVQDVMAHLTAVAEDIVAGRLTRPPSDEETAAQVARFDGRPVAEILDRWHEVAPELEPLVGTFAVWPAVSDVVSHEQDIRGALGLPGARDVEAIRLGAERLLMLLAPPVPLRIEVEDGQFRVGPQDGAELGLRTTRYEAFRWRLGRRSRAQLAGLDWSGDPSPVLDHLVVFGPAPGDIVE